MVDLKKLGERQITIDCDVIQADGGTRCAAITGAAVALVDAINGLQRDKVLNQDPVVGLMSAISVGSIKANACWISIMTRTPARTPI